MEEGELLKLRGEQEGEGENERFCERALSLWPFNIRYLLVHTLFQKLVFFFSL